MGIPFHPYTVKLRQEMERTRLQVRGHNGIADQAHLQPARVEEILAGDRPTEQEHRALCRALPRMKWYQSIVQAWLREGEPPKPPPPDPKAAPKSDPAPSAAPATSRPALPPTPPAPLMLFPRTWGEYLRAAREREGLSPEDLAELLDVSPAAVRAWEHDTSNPVADNYQRLLEVLPALTGPDVPKPAVRDIAVPKGRTGPELIPPRAAPRSAPAPSPRSGLPPLIAFGMSLARAQGALKAGRPMVVELLREGAAAGLSAEAIADALEAEP